MYNLLKYEIKSIAKEMVILISAILIIFVGILLKNYHTADMQMSEMTVGLSVMFSFIAFIVIFTFCIKIFSRDINGDTGYLLFTIPVKTWKIIASKLIMCFLMTLVAFLLFILMLSVSLCILDKTVLFKGMELLIQNFNFDCAIILLYLAFSYFYIILIIYLAIVISKAVLKGRKGGKLVGFIVFFIIQYINGKVMSTLGAMNIGSVGINRFSFGGQNGLALMNGGNFGNLGVDIIFITYLLITFIGFYLAIVYLIDKKMDL